MRLIRDLWNNLRILISMIGDSITGKYRGVSILTFVGLVIVLLYVFSPIDLMFDSIPLLGLLSLCSCLYAVQCETLVHIRNGEKTGSTNGTHSRSIERSSPSPF